MREGVRVVEYPLLDLWSIFTDESESERGTQKKSPGNYIHHNFKIEFLRLGFAFNKPSL